MAARSQGLDPTSISAEVFPYDSVAAYGRVGDTVFFRGTNGRYGAWKILSIESQPSFPLAYLSGQWYFQTDGTGNFTPGVVSAKATTWGTLKKLYR